MIPPENVSASNFFNKTWFRILFIHSATVKQKSLSKLVKIQLWFLEKIVDFCWVKNSWKCCGFGLFSSWQLWFHEKNCQKKIGKKTRENVGVLSKLNFGFDPAKTLTLHLSFIFQNQDCQELKSPKPQYFHEFFTQKIDNFLGKSKLNFLGQKMKISKTVVTLMMMSQFNALKFVSCRKTFVYKNFCWQLIDSVILRHCRNKKKSFSQLLLLLTE